MGRTDDMMEEKTDTSKDGEIEQQMDDRMQKRVHSGLEQPRIE